MKFSAFVGFLVAVCAIAKATEESVSPPSEHGPEHHHHGGGRGASSTTVASAALEAAIDTAVADVSVNKTRHAGPRGGQRPNGSPGQRDESSTLATSAMKKDVANANVSEPGQSGSRGRPEGHGQPHEHHGEPRLDDSHPESPEEEDDEDANKVEAEDESTTVKAAALKEDVANVSVSAEPRGRPENHGETDRHHGEPRPAENRSESSEEDDEDTEEDETTVEAAALMEDSDNSTSQEHRHHHHHRTSTPAASALKKEMGNATANVSNHMPEHSPNEEIPHEHSEDEELESESSELGEEPVEAALIQTLKAIHRERRCLRSTTAAPASG